MPAHPTPTFIQKHSEREMLLGWDSGERFALSYFELRFECPCAACVDEHTGQRTLKRESLDPAVRPLGVQPVGRYALQISWSDGHATGMYHFDRLNELCRTQGQRLPS